MCHAHLETRLAGAWLGWSGLMGWMRVPAAEGHLGERLAKTVDGVQLRLSRRRRDTPTPDLGTVLWAAGGRAAAARGPSPSPSRASSRRSDAETLSRATLMGEGQAVLLLARKGREGEPEGKSELPV